ncbi:MAG: hypothetical protein Q8K82_11515 [Gemmatimonadaceae bacterium]|nr:hypothetical protein [Gemmatimonadaceae bacterium]
MLSTSVSDLLFFLAALICAIAQVAVVRAAISGRTPGASASPLAQVREVFWVLLPAALLLFVFLWTWQSLPGRMSDHSPSLSPVSRASATDRLGPVGQMTRQPTRQPTRHQADQPINQQNARPADVRETT